MPLRKVNTAMITDSAIVAEQTIAVDKPAPTGTKLANTEWEIQERKRQRGQRWDSAIMSPATMQYAPTFEGYLELVARAADAGTAYMAL